MSLAFYILAGIILGSGVGVILMRNPIHSALCLIVNLIAVGGIFALLQAHFLAVVQIIVYAGAIMVLVLFVLMLLNVKEESQKVAGYGLLGLAIVCAVGFLQVLWPSLSETFPGDAHNLSGVVGSVEEIGRILFTKYVFPFEAASLLIMAGIVGAAMIAKTKIKKSGNRIPQKTVQGGVAS